MKYLCLLLAFPALAQAQAGPPADTIPRAVDRVFESWRDTQGPGCALGVSRNGATVYERGYGMANLETGTPIRPGSIFHVASISKQFTAMAVALLARDGKLSLDDDIRKYLADLPDYGTPITIRQLLNHTSGLRDQWELLALSRGRFEENRITEADVMDIVPRQRALNFKPGDEYLYSNTGYTLAAVIVKRVSGKSLREFADERIFRPLGMTSTHFHDDYHMLVPGRTSAYGPRGSGWRVSIPNFDVYGATSLFTTVGDLLKWEANFSTPTVGDAALLAGLEVRGRLNNGDSTAYGLGLTIADYRGAREVAHGGADAGYRSYVGRYPEHGLAIAVLCNAAPANPTALARSVAGIYLDKVLTPPPAPTVWTAADTTGALAARRAGVYLQPRTLQVVELTVRNGRLYTARQGGTLLVPLDADRFGVTGQSAELVFGPGERAGYEVRSGQPGARPLAFEWRKPFALRPGALTPYTGEFYSEELRSTYWISANDSTLRIRTGTEDGNPLRPVFVDGFVGGGYTVQFTRTGRTVSGFEVTNSRMRRVKFERVRPTP